MTDDLRRVAVLYARRNSIYKQMLKAMTAIHSIGRGQSSTPHATARQSTDGELSGRSG